VLTDNLRRYDPAATAAKLRRYIAEHDADRRTRAALIRHLDSYSGRLKLQNILASQLVGRLRRAALGYDADAQRVARSKHRQGTA
jgi:hypothetical protein